MFVYGSFVLLYTINFPTLSMSSTLMVMGVKQFQLVVMLLGAKEENHLVRLTLSSHEGFPYNDSLVAIIQNLKCSKKIMQNKLKVVNSIR
jgi:hypothetical protein